MYLLLQNDMTQVTVFFSQRTNKVLERIWSLAQLRSNLLSQRTLEQLEKLKAAYDAEVETLATNPRVWHDVTTFFVIACK
jgi:hypothetical protein